MKKQFFLSILFVGLISFLHAAYLKNVPYELIQPNGDTLHCFATGDEFYHYLHDADGFTIIQDSETGYFVYARAVEGKLISTSHIAGKTDPAAVGLVPFANITPEEWQSRREAFLSAIPSKTKSGNPSKANQGTMNNLVIFIRFSGDANITQNFSTVEGMFNAPTSSSVYNYFQNASYNQLSIVSHLYPEPDGELILSYEDIHPRDYYLPYNSTTNSAGYSDENERIRKERLLARATNYVLNSIPADLNLDYNNDGLIDNICYVVKGSPGNWSDLLWPHRSSLYGEEIYINGKRVWDYNFLLEGNSGYFNTSTFCHEMFHTLSAPDLYHYTNQGATNQVGSWDLMESNSTPPQHSGAYMKMRYGHWVDDIEEITEPGTYTLNAIGATNQNIAYKIKSENPDQFYVLEYRNKNSNYFETGLPGSGLLIYRINTNCNSGGECSGNAGYNGVTILDEVYLFRPGGSISSNGNISNANFGSNLGRTAFNPSTNPYPFLSDGTRSCLDISDITEAGGETIQFTYNATNHISANINEYAFGTGTGESFDIIINSDTYWFIDNYSHWYRCSKTSGYGTDTITVTSIDYNSDSEIRYDTILIKGVCASAVKVYLSQEAFIFYVNNPEIIFPAYSSEQVLTLYSNTNWRLLNNVNPCPDWLSFSTLSGTGTTDITISAQANPGIPRTCYLTYVSGGEMLLVEVKQQTPVGIECGREVSQDLSVYPNPTTHLLHVKNENTNMSIKNYSIHDMYGRTILNESSGSNDFTIDMKSYSSGIYLLKLIFDDQIIGTYKVVKQ